MSRRILHTVDMPMSLSYCGVPLCASQPTVLMKISFHTDRILCLLLFHIFSGGHSVGLELQMQTSGIYHMHMVSKLCGSIGDMYILLLQRILTHIGHTHICSHHHCANVYYVLSKISLVGSPYCKACTRTSSVLMCDNNRSADRVMLSV